MRLGDDVSIWYGGVLRGDLAPVTVGARTNVQDGTVVHVADDSPCDIGADCVVGHRAMLHACRVEDGCLIGMQATILDDAVVGAGSVVGAGALVTARTVIPPAQPGAGRARQGGADADRGRRGLPPRARGEIRPPEGELPPRRASAAGAVPRPERGFAGSWRRTALGCYSPPPWKSVPCENALSKLQSRLDILRGHL